MCNSGFGMNVETEKEMERKGRKQFRRDRQYEKPPNKKSCSLDRDALFLIHVLQGTTDNLQLDESHFISKSGVNLKIPSHDPVNRVKLIKDCIDIKFGKAA
ncbi:hypothetical protein EMCRGX_G001267 [Ephydatia muelleri]